MQALVERGVEQDRIEARGYGSERPLVPESDADALETNRRIEIWIVDPDPRD